jgi:hypothetical protein
MKSTSLQGFGGSAGSGGWVGGSDEESLHDGSPCGCGPESSDPGSPRWVASGVSFGLSAWGRGEIRRSVSGLLRTGLTDFPRRDSCDDWDQVRQAALAPAQKLRLPACRVLAWFRAVVRLSSTCCTIRPACSIPSPTSSVSSVISNPVKRRASRVGGSSFPRVSNNFSALRAARLSSIRVGMATTSTAVKLTATSRRERPSQNSGSPTSA